MDHAISPGADIHLFYTDPTIRQHYKDWIKHLVTRTNTITGLPYTQDSTIFSWELANEPRLENYERSNGLPVGSTICAWVKEMSDYIK